jgi:uncharacterized protein (TIGR00251 family)
MSRLTVRVIPNASRSEIAGREGAAWKIRLAAPPVDGKANDALIRFLADILDLAPSEIDIVKGHSSKTKILSVPMVEEDVIDRFQGTGS